MNKTDRSTCPRCGMPLPAGSGEQLCPACLLSGALKPPPDATVPMPAQPSSGAAAAPAFPARFGDYVLLGLLGRGGMGAVYEAEQLSTGRRVALKLLGQELDSPDMRQRFLREGRLAASVNHPNCLFVFGSEEIEGVPVIAMEIAGGGTLKDRLKQRGPFAVPDAVDAILDVIAGLESASAAGVLHRDIKPSNCFLSPDGSVKVGDFGLSVSTLAREDSYVTASGMIVGTPAYASPEQLRGDALDLRADIYSVGATLFTLLTDQVPFGGENAVQVVANVVNQPPRALRGFRQDLPPKLEQVINRCLAKDPRARYADYAALRRALLPFSSREPEPASIVQRVAAGWLDYLIAFLPPYLVLMLLVGAEKLLVRPLVDRTLYSARFYLLLIGIGFLYFTVTEGIWGAGLGKRLKRLRVMRPDGRPPGMPRALIRILIPILLVEGIRMPVTMTFISQAEWTGLQTVMYVLTFIVCGWIPALFALSARREHGFATLWDRASGTRVVVGLRGIIRPPANGLLPAEVPADGGEPLGPYRQIREIVGGQWILGLDPVLRRQVWLFRRDTSGPSAGRRNVTRPGRPRWLQSVRLDGVTWDAYEASPGGPLPQRIRSEPPVQWAVLRYWLHDLASELWAAAGDGTLPTHLSLDHVWITTHGRALLLDQPWPAAPAPASGIAVGDLAGQQRFLSAVADCVDRTGLPRHAAPVLENLKTGRFEKLSFLTGTLRGLLDRPSEVTQGMRAGSIFMLPMYVLIAVFLGRYHDKPWNDHLLGILLISPLAILGLAALVQLLEIPLRSTVGHSIFGLAVVDATGHRAKRTTLLTRWIIVWLPVIVSILMIAWAWPETAGRAFYAAVLLLLLWMGGAIHAAAHPHRGLHDRLAGTWVVRQ